MSGDNAADKAALSVTTRLYKCDTGRYVLHAVQRMWLRHWWWLALPPLACAVAAFFDPRWWFVVPMTVFLEYPFLLFAFYTAYGLTPQAQQNAVPHTATLDNTGITLTYPQHSAFDTCYKLSDMSAVYPGKTTLRIDLKRPRWHHIDVLNRAVDPSDMPQYIALAKEWQNAVNPENTLQ